MNGLHLIGDLSGCRCDPQLLLDGAGMRERCVRLVAEAGLTTMDANFHQFDGGGYTGMVLLAESHLALHTWPERQGITLDVYVCNYSADNSQKARKLFGDIIALFQPTEVARHAIDRNEHLLMEPLNDSTGFYIKASRQVGEWQTRFQKMQIYETPHYGRIFRLDGFNMTSEKEEFVYHENLVHPAAITHPKPERALIVGGGDGGSAEELLKHPSIRSVTLVEIDLAVVDISRKYLQAVHRGSLEDPRLALRIEDGLAFVRNSTEVYDLIVLDLTDPGGPSTPLYTPEFYKSCAARLNPIGAMTLHIASPVAHPARVRKTLADLRSAFPVVTPYLTSVPLYGGMWMMACCSATLDPSYLTPLEVERRLAQRGVGGLQYYNGDMHRAGLALPNFVKTLVA